MTDRDATVPQIDGDGGVVAFRSGATDLGPVPGHQAIWVRDLAGDHLQLASRADGAAGPPADGDVDSPSLDEAGDRVAFSSSASNLGAGIRAPQQEDYLRDLTSQTTELISRANGPGGAPADSQRVAPVSLSASGDCAVFMVQAGNLGDGFPSPDFDAVRMRVLRGTCGPADPSSGGGDPPPGPPLDPGTVDPPIPPPGDGKVPPKKTTPPPVLRSLAVRPSRFHVGGRGGGTKITFRLDRTADVTLRFERLTSGHLSHGRCRTTVRRGKRCTNVRRAGTLTLRRRPAGTVTVRFSGRMGAHALARGRYRLTATPRGGKPAGSRRLSVVKAPVPKHSKHR